jgi:hypothetical protein
MVEKIGFRLNDFDFEASSHKELGFLK